jgi:enoyl-[acyl-carrier protein] reductase I
MSFLNLEGKKIVVAGIANKKSVAWRSASALAEQGAEVICQAQGEEQAAAARKLIPGADVHLCNVSKEEDIIRCAGEIGAKHKVIHGLLHSIAFANYSEGMKKFHETVRADFLQAVDISCFSLISMVRHYKPFMAPDGAVVTISISTTEMAAENYGYMAPVKAALNSAVVFLAKSLSADTRIRVNAVGAGLLKTSASAGIPGYIDPYLFAEKATLRKEALSTDEVANTAVFLLSGASAGINAQVITVDAGMSRNYFDKDIVSKAVR